MLKIQIHKKYYHNREGRQHSCKNTSQKVLGSSSVDMQALFMGTGSWETAEWRLPLCCPARSAAESDWTAPPAPETAGQSCG